METTEQHSTFLERNSALIKGFFVAVLTLMLLIPTFMIQDLIDEREGRKKEAIAEVSAKWGNSQTLVGPVLRLPYYQISKVEKISSSKKELETTKTVEYAYFLPDKLKTNGKINPEIRHRGIYDVVVYDSKMVFDGEFSTINIAQLGIAPENVIWKDAVILLSINDFRGISDEVFLKWNNKTTAFNPGEALATKSQGNDMRGWSALSAPAELTENGNTKNVFHFELSLKGSESINFVPIGKVTEVSLESKWKNPSFDGAFLPNNRRVDENGFVANWKVLHLNRDFPQQWKTEAPNSLQASAFGVKLFTPNDSYQQTSRTIKYAFLIIALTFMAFFFIEILHRKRIHPLNYILIGLALCIFYTLLLSISEFTSFNLAYLIGTIMTIGLVFLYAKSVFANFKSASVVSLVMFVLYGFIFVIIQLQDTALLIGSIGLFLILGITMYVSRKIDWATVGIKQEN